MVQIMAEITDSEKAVKYYQAGHTQHKGGAWAKPPFVPSRVRLFRLCRGDGPFMGITVEPGEYECKSNRNGAVSVRASDGSMLGLRLDEFEPIEWRENI